MVECIRICPESLSEMLLKKGLLIFIDEIILIYNKSIQLIKQK
jgi:hypothetical protein